MRYYKTETGYIATVGIVDGEEITQEEYEEAMHNEEPDLTPRANKPITKGEYFYLDGKLCKAKTSIANGAILTLNTNYQETSMEDELSLLNK